MNRFQKIIVPLFFLISVTSYSQNWTLDACIDYALKHNLKLNNLNYTTKSSKESYRQSFRELLPSINANSSYNIQYGRSIDPNNNEIVSSDFFSNNYSIDASISIFQGFQKQHRITASKLIYEASKEETVQEKYLLAFRVMSAFYEVRFFDGLLQISKNQSAISLSNFNLVEKQIELGLKAGSDKYEAESVLIADRLLVTQSENNLQAAKLKLIQEMNLENTIAIKITASETIDFQNEKLLKIAADTVYNKALTFIPIIKAQELKVKAAEKDVSIAKGNLYPSLSFLAGYGTGYYETNINALGIVIPFRTQLKDNASQYIGLSLSIPISERFSSRSQIKQQKIALMQETNNLDIQKQELNKLIQELVQNFEATKIEFEQTKQSEAARLLTFNIAQKKYEKGLISALELYQSKNLYTNAQNENLQIKLQLKVQEKTLDFYMGLPVFNINTTR
ncbi:MAG: TolC family protein [Lutibacter sp.]